MTLPLWEDPIASGLEPETGGTFTVFNYPAYFYKKLLKEFGAKYGVDVQYTPFDNINSGLARLASGAVAPDVMEITPDTLDIGVAGKLIKPLNLDYIPNLQKNIWPQLVDPFYDGGSHYTVPYTCYATGIAWRTDHVTEDIAGHAAAVGHLLAVAGVQGQGGAPFGEPGDDRHGAPAQGASRTSTPRTPRSSTRRWPT